MSVQGASYHNRNVWIYDFKISYSLIPEFSQTLYWILIQGVHKKTERNANKQTAGKVVMENKHVF